MSDDSPTGASGTTATDGSDNRLGGFLRSRRDAVRPADVGLPAGPRRRTPGLRRSEVAMLAGVSVEYLTRLEQGRDRNPSSQVLGALADALRLSPGDRHALRVLAKVTGGDSLCAELAHPPADCASPALLAVLDRLDAGPALVVNRVGDILAHTTGYAAFAGPLGMLDVPPPNERPNLIRYLFADPRAVHVHPDWETVAEAALVPLRATACVGDEHVSAFVSELTAAAGARFTERWAAMTSRDVVVGPRRVTHPDVGEVRVVDEAFHGADQVPGTEEQRLVIVLPADAASTEALDRLTRGRPAPLRAVVS